MDIICVVPFRHNVKYEHGSVDTLSKWILIIRPQHFRDDNNNNNNNDRLTAFDPGQPG